MQARSAKPLSGGEGQAQDGAADPKRARFLETIALLENDFDVAIAEVQAAADAASGRAANSVERAASISQQFRTMTGAASSAAVSMDRIVADSQTLTIAGQRITDLTTRSAAVIGRAVQRTEAASRNVDTLAAGAEDVGRVIDFIQEVATRTNLLALNAAVEAARAGDAGRGFAVIAAEIRQLSLQTKAAAGDIGQLVASMRSATVRNAEMFVEVRDTVREIATVNAGVVPASSEQARTLGSVADHVGDVARQVAEASRLAAAASQGVAEVESDAIESARAAADVRDQIDALRSKLVVSLRATAGDRQSEPRTPVSFPAQLLGANGEREPGVVLDLTTGGALVAMSGPRTQLARAAHVTLVIAGLCRIDGAQVVGRRGRNFHLRFLSIAPAAKDTIRARLAEINADDARFFDAAKAASAKISAAFDDALRTGMIDEAGLFDESYRLIDGTEPPQFLTRFTELTDRLLPAIQEKLLTFDPRVVFSAAVDRNGYLPTHNTMYSRPQRKDDPVWNAAHARNRRIFADTSGMAAARCGGREVLVQNYDRDMGGGRIMALKEVDAAIRVRDRHWGALRLAYFPLEHKDLRGRDDPAAQVAAISAGAPAPSPASAGSR